MKANRLSHLDTNFICQQRTNLSRCLNLHIAPGAHWLYEEKLLSDVYDETYPFEE